LKGVDAVVAASGTRRTVIKLAHLPTDLRLLGKELLDSRSREPIKNPEFLSRG
jgi:hypothetical protein